MQDQTACIDWQGIQSALSQLEQPLDFETDNPGVPRFDRMHPYGQFPFQCSCHMLQEKGSLCHGKYLHRDQTDPRLPLTEHLVTDSGKSGTAIAYNAGFE